MKKLLLIFASLFLSSTFNAAYAYNCEQPVENDCFFYVECLEEKFECGYTGYPVSYGFKFCRKFQKAKRFSPRGKAWITSTMLCLQKALVPFANDSYPVNEKACGAVEDWGFSTHSACYTEHENSFCFLGPLDLMNAINVIGPGALVGNPKARRQVKEVMGICLRKLARLPGKAPQYRLIEDAYKKL